MSAIGSATANASATRTFAAATSARPATSSVIRNIQFAFQVERHGQRETNSRNRQEHHRHRRPEERPESTPLSGVLSNGSPPPVRAQEAVQHERSRGGQRADDEALMQDTPPDRHCHETTDGASDRRTAVPSGERNDPSRQCSEKETPGRSPDRISGADGRNWRPRR